MFALIDPSSCPHASSTWGRSSKARLAFSGIDMPAFCPSGAGEAGRKLEDGRDDQVDVVRARAPVDDRRTERDLPVLNGRAEVDPPVVQHRLTEPAVEVVDLFLRHAGRAVAEADHV